MNHSDLQTSKEQRTEEVAPAKGPAKAGEPDAQSKQRASNKIESVGPAGNVADNDDPEFQHIEVCETFDDMNLKDDLLRGVYANGFMKPSYIQQRAVIPVINGHDTIAQAQSGFGKTATFCIAALETVEPGYGTQKLILAPTRELANQIHDVLSGLGQYMQGLNTRACVGGTSVRDDREALREGVDIVVGTPGRCFDMIQRGVMDLKGLRTMILDEADQMLDRGFQEQVYEIFAFMPQDVQVALFSATMPDRVLELTSRFMRNPKKILLKTEDVTLSGIRQYYVDCEREEYKYSVLCDLYENLDIQAAIIFVNSKQTANWLAERMNQEDHTVSVIHSGIPNEERKHVMREFRAGQSRVLISSDLLARGIDVQQVSLVINYDIPKPHQKESYIHRIGRSGRFGKKGCAINFVTEKDVRSMRTIEEFYSTEIVELPEDIAFILA